MSKFVRTLSWMGLASLALGCGDSNPAPKVAVEKKPIEKPTQNSEAAQKQMMEESLKKNGGGAKGTPAK